MMARKGENCFYVLNNVLCFELFIKKKKNINQDGTIQIKPLLICLLYSTNYKANTYTIYIFQNTALFSYFQTRI